MARRWSRRGDRYSDDDELMTVRSIASVEFNRSGKLPIGGEGDNKYVGRDAVSAIGNRSSTWTHKARRTNIRNNILYSYRSKAQNLQDAQLISIKRSPSRDAGRLLPLYVIRKWQKRAHHCFVTLTLWRFSWVFWTYMSTRQFAF